MAVNSIDKEKNKDRFINFILFFMLLFLVCAIGLGCIYIMFPEGDVMEHIHSTVMVSEGKIPYRDFFEHHHPLLWYIMVWLVRLLNHNPEITGIANYVTFCFFMWGLYFVYRLCVDFLSTKTAALLALIYILTPNIFLYFVYFKPDNWLIPCVSGGVYYYFCYLQNKRRYDLVVAFLFFFAGFLFIQKALLYWPAFAAWVLYALYKKEMLWRDFLAALVLPIVLGCAFLGYFYYHGALKQYFVLNFMFNNDMRQYFGDFHTSEPFYMGYVIFGAALFASIGLYKYENRYFRIYCSLFWLLVAEKAFYFSPYVYYWYEAYYFALPIAAAGIIMLAQKIRILLYIVVFETLVYAGNIGYDVFSDVHYFYIRHNATMQEVILQRTNKCDKWLGFGFSSFNLFLDAPIYYWFLQGHVDVFGEEMGIHPIEDLNALIEKYKPKMIYVDRVYERYDISEHQRVVHEPNMEMINKYYMPTEYASDNDGLEIDEETAQIRDKKLDFIRGLYILKPEYRQIKCMYDKEQNKWRYADE